MEKPPAPGTTAEKPLRAHRCENCRFWDRDNIAHQDPTNPAVAPCLRFPPVIVVVPVPVMKNPRQIITHPNANVPMHMEPRPVPVLPFSQAVAWCGEHDPFVAEGLNGS